MSCSMLQSMHPETQGHTSNARVSAMWMSPLTLAYRAAGANLKDFSNRWVYARLELWEVASDSVSQHKTACLPVTLTLWHCKAIVQDVTSRERFSALRHVIPKPSCPAIWTIYEPAWANLPTVKIAMCLASLIVIDQITRLCAYKSTPKL